MESVAKKTAAALLIRRIVAIALMALSIGCLFWPSIVDLQPDLTDLLEDHLPTKQEYDETIARETDRLFEDIEEMNDRFYEFTRKSLPKNPFSRGDIRKDSMKLYRLAEKGALTVLDVRSTAALLRKYVVKGSDYLTDILKRADREFLDSGRYGYSERREYETQYRSDLIRIRDELQDYTTAVRYGAIGVDVLFFATLAFGVLAILMMLLNLPNLNPVHTVFAFLLSGVFVAAVILGNKGVSEALSKSGQYELPDTLLRPGASMFLMPLLSLAACIVYKRNKRTRGAEAEVPASEAEPQYADGDPVGANAQRQYSQQNAAAYGAQQRWTARNGDWTCPNCGAQNAATSKFCCHCGSPKASAQQKEVTFCAACGHKIDADLPFCPYCGAKQP